MSDSATTTTRTEQLRAAVHNFEAVQRQYRQYGAQDTEPDSVFQNLLMRAVKGKPARVPTGAGAWELYYGTMDCAAAAAALAEAAQAAIDIIQDCPIGQSDELKKYVCGYCWRYT